MLDSLNISTATKNDFPAWDDYIHAKPSSCFYQSSMWARFLTGYMGFAQRSLVARRENRIVGILPLYLVSQFPLGSKLISIPFNMTAGGAASDDGEVHRALLKSALETGQRLRVKYLEIRTASQNTQAMEMGFAQRKPFFYGEIPLVDRDANYKRLDSSRRTDLNHALRAGVGISENSSLEELYQYHNRVLTPHFKQRGNPLFSFGFLKAIWEQGGPPRKNAVLITARLDNVVVGGIILYCHGNTVMLKSLASLPRYWRTGVNAALVWAGIEYGLRNHYQVLDFGISGRDLSEAGQVHFKKDMGSDIKDTFSYTYAFQGSPTALENFSENRTKFVRKVWSLMPEVFTRPLGALIVKWLC